MPSKSKNILIFGGTGTIGEFITQAILDARRSCSFERIAIFTSAKTVSAKSSQLDKWKGQGLEIITGVVTDEQQIQDAYKGFDTVISALGRGAINLQILLIRLAEATPNIHTFYPSEYGTDIEYYGAGSAHEKPHQQKLAVRKFIRENISKLHITYLVTGPFADSYMGKAKNPIYGSFDIKGKSATLLGDGDGKISLTTKKDTGVLLVAALMHPEVAKGQALKVNSFTTTPKEILEEYEKQTGGQEWKVKYTSLEDLKKAEEEAWVREDPMATVYTLRRIWTGGGTLYDERDNGKIGEPKVDTLADMVAELVRKAG